MSQDHQPYIPSSTKLPETTIKAFVLGALLSMLLSAANAYLGLFAGLTVSASIPAAVLSMAILRLFKNHNILENNIVQTAASAGESLAAGVIFTFPALVLMGYWDRFDYWETVLIALSGGVLGVLFTVPLRSALIVKQKLQFPEGVATSEVLKTGEKGGKAVKYLIQGSLIGAGVKLAESGLKLWTGTGATASMWGGKIYAFIAMNLSPALIGVGYIVGLRISFLVFAGGVISWYIAIPWYIAANQLSPEPGGAVDLGYQIWTSQIRYLGVGAMVVGGLWALIKLRGSIGLAVQSGIQAIKQNRDVSSTQRTERDTPMQWVLAAIVVMIIPIFLIYLREIHDIAITGMMAVFMVIAGFLFSAVAGYMAGLVGSSNNPISGVTIATILTASLILVVILGADNEKGPAAAILIGAVVCCAAAIAGDNMQDLKAGHVLGATPQNQQIMQMVGVVSAALVMPLVLQLLMQGFGFGPATEANPDSLAAPQATLMQSVAEGVFSGDLPWPMVYAGMVIGTIVIILDQIQERRGSDFRIPVLAVAVGIYLPFELDSAIMLGGIVAWLVQRYHRSRSGDPNYDNKQKNSENSGLLIASGLITGEALMGLTYALIIVLTGSRTALAIADEPFDAVPGVIVIAVLCFWIYSKTKGAFSTEE
ncbi:MAG: oligopeptide transporter, OPT family [Bacteroidota bacterium]